jgi:hypothetical protein
VHQIISFSLLSVDWAKIEKYRIPFRLRCQLHISACS